MRSHNQALLKTTILACVIAFVSAFSSAALANPFVEDRTKYQAQEREITDLELGIHHLLKEKHHADNPAHVKEIIDAVAEKYRQLSKLAADHEKLGTHIRFKHPEQADKIDNVQYSRFKLKTLEQMESEVGIDGRLDRIKARVLATFPAPQIEAPAPPEPKIHPFYRKPASVEEDAPEEIKLVK